MTIGEGFALHLLIVVLVIMVVLLLLAWVVSLVWLRRVIKSSAATPARRPQSTLDLIGAELSRLDRLDGLGGELR